MCRAQLAVLAAVMALAGCGGEDGPDREKPQPLGPVSGGSSAQYVDCGDWRGGSVAERHATIDELRGQLTPQSSRTARSPLSDERAYEILDKACRHPGGESLRLYKLYVQAQGFAPLNDP
jgi:hypothetical protein